MGQGGHQVPQLSLAHLCSRDLGVTNVGARGGLQAGSHRRPRSAGALEESGYGPWVDWVVAHKLTMRLSAPPRQYLGGQDIAWVAMADYVRCVNPHPLGSKNSGMQLDRKHYHAGIPTSINKPTLHCRHKHRLICSHLKIQSGAMDWIKMDQRGPKRN